MKPNSVIFFKNERVKPIPGNCSLVLAAWELKNPQNMGHIIRLAHNSGAENVLFITEGNTNYRESKIKKTAGFSFEQQKWQLVSTDDFFSMINNKTELVILETCKGATNIFETKLPSSAIILAGNESRGLPQEIIGKNKLKVYIPMPGGCKSMNISHAMSVAAFEWYRQFML